MTSLCINKQGPNARVKPGDPLRFKVDFIAQNPEEDPNRILQLILFLDDKFLKCVYNDIPRTHPNVTRGSVSFGCDLPLENGKYTISSGWAYNWPWPLDAYNHLLSNPKNIEKVGTLTVGLAPTEEV